MAGFLAGPLHQGVRTIRVFRGYRRTCVAKKRSKRPSVAAFAQKERRRTDRSLSSERKAADVSLGRPRGAKKPRRQRQEFDSALVRERGRTDRDLRQERDRTDTSAKQARARFAKLHESRSAALAALLERNESLAVVSHDLRTPLNAISLCAQELSRSSFTGEQGDRVRGASERLVRAINRMERLISDLLDTERISGGKLQLDPREGDLRAVVLEAVQLLRPMAEERELSIATRLPERPAACFFDHGRLFQAVSNLIDNAIKFTPKGGAVTVGIDKDEEEVRITVRDTGPGIPLSKQEAIFDRFTQLGRGERGLGLGLYITRRIGEEHGGRVELQSESGSGSTFSIVLPRRSPRSRGIPRPLSKAKGRRGRSKNP